MVVTRDPASAANLAAYEVTHTDLQLAVDFPSKTLFGRSTLTVKIKQLCSEIVLDCHNVDVKAIAASTAGGAAVSLQWQLKPFAPFGGALVIDVAPLCLAAGSEISITIYQAASSGAALCWLDPAQTAGKQHPFLFTQGQACLNRSIFPCVDSPSQRMTWAASLIVDRQLVAVASAVRVAPAEVRDGEQPVGEAVTAEALAVLYPLNSSTGSSNGLPSLDPSRLHAFRFRMPHSVPSYLIAFAVGDLRSASIGPRSAVWAEPSLIDKARYEFGDGQVTEKYVATGEALFGPYRWDRYDILCCPPSFPYGGMENPCMTFVTPALLAGDQSLTDVVCHEVAHLWSGNLTTNAMFSQFFLNEGWTMYCQRRITSVVHGSAVTALETVTGRALLVRMVDDYGVNSPLSRLHVPLEEGVDPDETYCEAPYEKGFAFVSYLRAMVGSDDAFDGWLKAYFGRFAFVSITSTDMLTSFFDAFPTLKGDWDASTWEAEDAAAAPAFWEAGAPVPSDLEASGVLLPWDPSSPGVGGKRGLAYRPGYEFSRWFHQPGWPVYYPPLAAAAASLTGPAEALVAQWVGAVTSDRGDSLPSLSATAPGVASWPTYQTLHFLDTLIAAATPLPEAQLDALLPALDAAYGFGTHNNAEVRLRWGQLVGAAGYAPGYASVASFLAGIGKQKYQLPLYRALCTQPQGSRVSQQRREGAKAAAGAIFAQTQASLHVAVRGFAAKILAASGVAV